MSKAVWCVASATGLLLFASCSGCESVENFSCGAKLQDGTATVCDGPNEVCVCATQRCATPSETCASGFAWRFDPVTCVDADLMRTRLEKSGPTSFCPGVNGTPEACGVLAADRKTFTACAEAQLCLCGVSYPDVSLSIPTHSCVVRDGTCPESGLARAYSGECLVATSSRGMVEDPGLVLRSADDPACPGSEIFPRTCGMSTGLNDHPCGAGHACFCGVKAGGGPVNLAPNTCVEAGPGCSDGGLALRDRDGVCLTGAGLTDLVLLFDGQGDCPGLDIDPFRPDAGTPDAGQDAGIPSCGRGEPADVTCNSNEACLCGARTGSLAELNGRYSCVNAWAPCADEGGTGLRFRDGRCVEGAVLGDLILRFDGEACPGFDIHAYLPDAGEDIEDGGKGAGDGGLP